MLISKFGKASKADIDALGENLPQQLKIFLEKYNGGETPETSFFTGNISSNIVGFYGVGNVKYSYSQVRPFRFDNNVFLPIAFDSFGNKIVICMQDGSIGFYDHEKQQNPLSVIAPDLKAFFAMATSNPIDPKHLKPIEEREYELIARGKGSNITDALRGLWQAEIDKYAHIKQEAVSI